MTDDMDLGGMLVLEAARRNKILDDIVFDQLQCGLENAENESYYLSRSPQWHYYELCQYSVDFEDPKWQATHNRLALTASIQRWLDAKASRKAAT